MQVLWSRVAQTRSSCHCRSCYNAATTIARRATTAASRRGLKVGDIFTACYSAVLATAAVADARVKDDRRKEWDRLIAEAKGGRNKEGDGADKMAEGTKAVSEETELLPFGIPVNGAENAVDVSPGNSYLAQNPNYTPFAVQLRVLDAHIKQSITKSTKSTQPDPIPRSAEALISQKWVDEDDPHHLLQAREPGHNILYLEKTEENISRLVSRLLLASRTRWRPANGSDTSSQMKQMAESIDALQSGHTQLPEFSWRSTRDVMEERERLHWSLITIFEKAASDTTSQDILVAKICYNLLVSTAPPSIITFNILIRGFNQLQHIELGELVVQAYLEESKYKPNPATAKITLDHYASKDDLLGFKRVIRRMRAVDGDMRVRRRRVEELCYPEVQHWALTAKVIHRNGFLHEKFPRNFAVFDALIKGSLKSAELRSAVVYASAALREGQQIKKSTLSELVSWCINKSNLLAAKKLLSSILKAWKRDLDPNVYRSRESRSILYRLLNFCCIDPSIDGDVGILENSYENVVRSIIFYLRVEDARYEIERFSGVLSKLEELLAVSKSEWSFDKGMTTGKYIHLTTAILDKYSAEFEIRITQRYNDALRLVARQLKVADSMHLTVINIYFDRLPWEVKMEYNKKHHHGREHTLARRVKQISKLYRKAEEVKSKKMWNELAEADSIQPDKSEEHFPIAGYCSPVVDVPQIQRGSYHSKNPPPLLSSPIFPPVLAHAAQ